MMAALRSGSFFNECHAERRQDVRDIQVVKGQRRGIPGHHHFGRGHDGQFYPGCHRLRLKFELLTHIDRRHAGRPDQLELSGRIISNLPGPDSGLTPFGPAENSCFLACTRNRELSGCRDDIQGVARERGPHQVLMHAIVRTESVVVGCHDDITGLDHFCEPGDA